MKKHLFFLVAGISLAIIIATVVVLQGYASLRDVSIGLLLALASSALLWQKVSRKSERTPASAGNGSGAMIWLLVLFVVPAAVAFIQSMHQKWDIGDTIGTSFFALFAGLSIYEIIRRRKKIDSNTRPK